MPALAPQHLVRWMPTTGRVLRPAPGHQPETHCSQGPGCLLGTVGVLGLIRQLAAGTTVDFPQMSAKGYCIAQASSQFPQESLLFSKGLKLSPFGRLILTRYCPKKSQGLAEEAGRHGTGEVLCHCLFHTVCHSEISPRAHPRPHPCCGLCQACPHIPCSWEIC